MIINVIGGIKENYEFDKVMTFNAVVSVFMVEALRNLGIEARHVPYYTIYKHNPPPCDHSLLVVGSAFVEFDTRRAEQRPHIFGTTKRRQIAKEFCERIHKTTRDKVTTYLDSNYKYWDSYFDRVFTITPPQFPFDPKSEKFERIHGAESKKKTWIHPERYVYAGWGASPEYCYPDKNDQKTIFIDAYERGAYFEKTKSWYEIYDRVLDDLADVKIYDYRGYTPTTRRLPWYKLQKVFQKSHFYVDPQLGKSGLTRIESAMCGCLLVTAKPMFQSWAMGQLETATWETEDELREIFEMETDPDQIHEKVKDTTWDKVAERIVRELESDGRTTCCDESNSTPIKDNL